MRDYHSVNYQE